MNRSDAVVAAKFAMTALKNSIDKASAEAPKELAEIERVLYWLESDMWTTLESVACHEASLLAEAKSEREAALSDRNDD